MKKRTKQKNFFNSFLAFLILAAMLIGSISQVALADDYEAGKTGNITLTIQENGDDGTPVPIPDVKMTLYKVGNVSFDGNVHFSVDSALQSTGIDFENIQTAEEWKAAAESLASAVKTAGISGSEMQSDTEGKIVYTNMEEGVYLIVQSEQEDAVTVLPMLLTVPFAEEGTGWTYDVQAYPKASVNDKKETQIQVTKQLFYIDDAFNITEMEAKDAVYKVGLFLDAKGEIPFRNDYIKEIRIVNAHSGTATWSNVPDNKYYVIELDDNDAPLEINSTIEVEQGKTFYYNVTDTNNNESNEVVISQDNSTESVSYVNNYFSYIPNGFSLRGYISIEKKVLINGNEDTVEDTFYAGVFKEDSDGTLELVENTELRQNGSVTVEVSFEADTEPDSVIYTVMETDKDGNPIDQNTFPYKVSGEGDIILNKDENYENSMTITNRQDTEPDPTITPTVTPEATVTPGAQPSVTPTTPSERTNTPVPGNNDSSYYNNGGTTGRTSVKTGDDTPIGIWIGILAAAIVVGGGAGFAVRKKKKK